MHPCFGGMNMYLKVYNEERCPVCQQLQVSERTRRNRLIRYFYPDTKQMRCWRCNTRYLVRYYHGDEPVKKSQPQSRVLSVV